jgi:hypothetical protein
MSTVAHRAMYARTSGDMMVGGWDSSAGVNPSGQPPVIWWNGLDSGGLSQPIGPHGPWIHGNAEALPAVTRATALIVDPIAQSPLVVQDSADTGRPIPTPRWLTDPCLTRRDDRVGEQVLPAVLRLGRAKWVADLLRSALWWGLGAFVAQESETGEPLAGTMKLIHPGFLSTERPDGASGPLHWVLGAELDYENRIVFDRDGYASIRGVWHRITVLRNPASPVDVEGGSMGVFAMSPSAFNLAGQLASYSSGVFQSGVPSGYLKVNSPGTTQAQVDELKAAWNMAHGSTSRRSTAVLNAVTEYVPISMSPVDTALAEVSQLSIVDCAYAFGISPEMLGASMGTSMTYANIRDHFRSHRDLGIGIWISALQDVLSALLPGTQSVRVDTDAFTRPEPKERYEAYQVALDAGILTVDEVRANEGLPPLPEQGPDTTRQVPAPVSTPEPEPEPEPEPAAVRSLRSTQAWRR